MPSARRAARAASLPALVATLRRRHHRDRKRLFVLERVGSFLRAVDQAVPIVGVVTCPILLRSTAAKICIRRLRRDGVPILEVDPPAFRSLSVGTRASGILAIARQRWTRLEDLDPNAGTCWLAAENIRSPGNLGTMLRTAEAAGAAGLICIGDALDPYHPSVVSASMGAVPLLTFARTRLGTLSRWARAHSVAVVAADPKAVPRWDRAELPERRILLLGEERNGLTPEAYQASTHQVALPILGRSDSLNVAVAAGVLLYELVRRA